MSLRKWLTDRITTVLPIATAGKDRFLAFLSICTLAHNTRTDCTLSLLKITIYLIHIPENAKYPETLKSVADHLVWWLMKESFILH